MMVKFYNWYGGKQRMVPIIRWLLPEYKSYYEVFMGSASLLLNTARCEREVLNDLDPDLAHLMGTLADRKKGKMLMEKLFHLEYGQEVFEKAKACAKSGYAGLSDIDRAVKVYVQITQSFNNTRKTFRKNIDTWKYQRDIRFDVPKAYKRLDGVEVWNRDAINVLAEIKGDRDAFVFADPPYRHELRGKSARKVYHCELSESDQIRLLETIRDAECKIMLCGYKAESGPDLYDRYLLPYGWHCYKLMDVPKSCQTKKDRDMAEEFIWVNYELPHCARYKITLEEDRRLF